MSTSSVNVTANNVNADAAKTEDKKKAQQAPIEIALKYTPENITILMAIFARAYGEDKLKKVGAVQLQGKFRSFCNEMLKAAFKNKRNSQLQADYAAMLKDVNHLVDDEGMSYESAEQEVFGMSGKAFRRKLAMAKAAQIF